MSPYSAKWQMNKQQTGSYTYEVKQLYVTVVWKQMCVLSLTGAVSNGSSHSSERLGGSE
jgi:hypothetical protein